MTGEDDGTPGGVQGDRGRATFSLRRWSQRKHDAARGVRGDARASAQEPPAGAADGAAASAPPTAEPAVAAQVAVAPVAAGSAAHPAQDSAAPALPSIESLTADSDFAPFMRPGVDPDVRREALKKLLHDPRFNVMDGLDVYIDDYTKTKPIDPSLARRILARLHPRSLAADDETAVATVVEADGAAPRTDGRIDAGSGETPSGAAPATPGVDASGDAGGAPARHCEREP